MACSANAIKSIRQTFQKSINLNIQNNKNKEEKKGSKYMDYAPYLPRIPSK